MSNFTIGLAILGGLVLAALVAWNAWSTRRLAPRQPEPAAAAPAEAAPDGVDARREPVLLHDAALPAAATALGPVPGPADKRAALDALIDTIAPIALEAPVSGEAALAVLPPTRRAGSKPFSIEGQNEVNGQWEHPRAGQRYSAFQAGVQLANRTGALNDIEFSEFVMKAQGFADAIGGAPDFPDMRHEVARARELDQFAGSHDAQLSFTLRARQAAWSPGYVQQHAARWGFVPGAVPGRLVLPATQAGAPPVLGLAFDTQAALADDPTQTAIREIVLTVDVPQVPRSEQPFVRMRDVAIGLAASMEGAITDDHGQVISAAALDAIGADLETLYDTLESRDLAAGSPQARRLFG